MTKNTNLLGAIAEGFLAGDAVGQALTGHPGRAFVEGTAAAAIDRSGNGAGFFNQPTYGTNTQQTTDNDDAGLCGCLMACCSCLAALGEISNAAKATR